VSEFDFEPVHGLPEHLPEGEVLRWQGAPKWRALALRAFHVRKVGLYFGLLILARFAFDLGDGTSLSTALMSGSWLLALALLAMGILTLLAWLYGRSTVYTITNKRVVIRFGVALSIAVNIPFKVIESAGLRRYGGGVGDIPLGLMGGQSVNYIVMWPNVRPWRFFNAQPMLRCVPDVDTAAEILAEALRASADAEQERVPSERPAQGGQGIPPMNAEPVPSR